LRAELAEKERVLQEEREVHRRVIEGLRRELARVAAQKEQPFAAGTSEPLSGSEVPQLAALRNEIAALLRGWLGEAVELGSGLE
jgi:hypothetical protein